MHCHTKGSKATVKLVLIPAQNIMNLYVGSADESSPIPGIPDE
jgi:hypothetical protein